MDHEHIDDILVGWPYNARSLTVRMAHGSDGREVLQMRVDMGLLQLEIEGRPDRERPEGEESFLAYLRTLAERYGDEFVLSEGQCDEVDREFVQFYHRRVCWLKLQEYERAVRDADHTLALMDFCRQYSPDEQWTMTHEQYRPFVLFHRSQAAAFEQLEGTGPEAALQEINVGLERIHEMFVEMEVEEHYEDDELVQRLRELRESLRTEYNIGRTLQEQLQDAVDSEQYELAARLRDELAKRGAT